jgi:hypothetical protein
MRILRHTARARPRNRHNLGGSRTELRAAHALRYAFQSRGRPDYARERSRSERGERQSELIRRWRPWEQSTGPRTGEGKATVSRNAYKGAVRQQLRTLARALREAAQVCL